MLVAKSPNGFTMLWDVAKGAMPLRVLKGLFSKWAVAWSPDGAMLCTGAAEDARIWDVARSAVVHILEGDGDSVTCVAWSCGGVVATGSKTGTVRLWDAMTGAPVHMLKCEQQRGEVKCVVFSPDGSMLAACGKLHH